MTRYLILPAQLVVYAFTTLTAAQEAQTGNQGSLLVEKESDMEQLSSDLLVNLHNKIRPEKPIKKFADRATAVKRMWPALDALADMTTGKARASAEDVPQLSPPQEQDASPSPNAVEDSSTSEGTTMANATKSRKRTTPTAKKNGSAKAAKAESNGRRGRPSQYAGKVITKLSDENPRREGSLGYKSFAAIRNGMTVEKYLEAGGRIKDLAYDVQKKFVKVSKAD